MIGVHRYRVWSRYFKLPLFRSRPSSGGRNEARNRLLNIKALAGENQNWKRKARLVSWPFSLPSRDAQQHHVSAQMGRCVFCKLRELLLTSWIPFQLFFCLACEIRSGQWGDVNRLGVKSSCWELRTTHSSLSPSPAPCIIWTESGP